jgi:hypothetical protein
MRDMPDRELKKLHFLAVKQALWETAREINTEVVLDLKHLKKLTLVVERSESVDSREVAFEDPKESDSTYFEDPEDDEPDLSDESIHGMFWPEDSEDYLKYILDDVCANHVCDPKRPRVEFKVLVPAE